MKSTLRECIEHEDISHILKDNTSALIFDTFHIRGGRTFYFTGIHWLKEASNIALWVKPKIPNIDIVAMFAEIIRYGLKESGSIFDIAENEKDIVINSDENEITIFIVLEYIKILKNLLKKGLIKEPIDKQENLNGKAKGKLLFTHQLKRNIMQGREDRMFCRFSEASVDCNLNRVLKMALQFSTLFLQKINRCDESYLYLLSAFDGVSDITNKQTIQTFKVNKIFKDYTQAVRLAKIIIKMFGYDIQRTLTAAAIPISPYRIDMSKLFEQYVYIKVKERFKDAKFQTKGKYGYTDILIPKQSDGEQWIIDAKYKKIYAANEYDIADIRQVAGYARDEDVRKAIGADNAEKVECLIMYPDQNAENHFNLFKKKRVNQFVKIWKLGICLPIKKIID